MMTIGMILMTMRRAWWGDHDGGYDGDDYQDDFDDNYDDDDDDDDDNYDNFDDNEEGLVRWGGSLWSGSS